MTKRKKNSVAKQVNETHLQWQSRIARTVQNTRERGALVNVHAAQHGNYAANDDGSRINHAASLLAKWRANKILDINHEAAIAYCMRLWDLLAQEPRVTANYGETIVGGFVNYEANWLILARVEAKEDLSRIAGGLGDDGRYRDGYIPPDRWRMFENCIRFDEPTGCLGSKLHGGTQTQRTRAHTVCLFVAEIICMKEGLVL